MAAAVQGMDESVINGANLFFTDQFGLTSDPNDLSRDLIHGLVLGAPYLCCATVACWLNDPLNRLLGRRGVIFLTAWISAISCIWQGFTNSWQHLFVARFFLFVQFLPFVLRFLTPFLVGASESAPSQPLRQFFVQRAVCTTSERIARLSRSTRTRFTDEVFPPAAPARIRGALVMQNRLIRTELH